MKAEKFNTFERAHIRAYELSKDNSTVAVILSEDKYYVDDNTFIRTWEKLLEVFEEGKLITY